MAKLTLQAMAERQLRLLAHVCETLTARALAGTRADLDSLFLAQEHLEHWLQYLSPLALEPDVPGLDAPPPLPSMRPAPALDTDPWAPDETPQQPRVSFPPEPLWVEDLERVPEEDER
jgi:hypothetical protein